MAISEGSQMESCLLICKWLLFLKGRCCPTPSPPNKQRDLPFFDHRGTSLSSVCRNCLSLQSVKDTPSWTVVASCWSQQGAFPFLRNCVPEAGRDSQVSSPTSYCTVPIAFDQKLSAGLAFVQLVLVFACCCFRLRGKLNHTQKQARLYQIH